MKQQKHCIASIMAVVVAIAALVLGCGSAVARHNAQATPDGAGIELPDFANTEDIVHHTGYTTSYNHTTLCPNWVAWQITAERLRMGDSLTLEGLPNYRFCRDPQVGFPKASYEDYKSTGDGEAYDKGHMAPRADMKYSLRSLEESYYLSNVCPQNHTMNAQAWRKIEELCRRIAKHYGQAWVVCGPIFDSVPHRHIGQACVHVPDRFFKAVAINAGGQWHTVGFIVENNSQSRSPRHYAVCTDSIEATINRNLFPTLPESAEANFDWATWAL